MEKLFQKGVVVDLSNLVDYSAGGVVSKQIVISAAGNISLFSFDKGEGLSEHTAPFDALVQILEGEMEIVVDGNHSRMKAGESLVLPANVPHALTAVQRFKMLLTMIKEKIKTRQGWNPVSFLFYQICFLVSV